MNMKSKNNNLKMGISVMCLIMKISYTYGQGCPGFFSPTGSQQRHKEFRDVVSRSWDEAAKRCNDEGLVMASLPSDATAAAALSNHIRNSCGGYLYWLDARRSGSGQGFVWSDGSPVEATVHPDSDTSATQCLELQTTSTGLHLWTTHCTDPSWRYTLCQEPTQRPATQPPPTQRPATQPPPTQRPTTRRPPTQRPSTRRPPTQRPSTRRPPTQRPAATFRPASCGQTHMAGASFDERTVSSRIANGMPTITGQYPWMVHLTYHSSFLQRIVPCGGTLVSKRWVLSAAHCFSFLKPNVDLIAKIGFTHLKKQENESLLFQMTLDNIIIHDEFSATTLVNDIALARLPQDVPFGNLIQPICIGTNQHIPFGRKAIAAGWGLHAPSDPEIPNLLHAVELDILEESACEEKTICAFTPGKDTCQGDSGGPIMIKQGNQWWQLGIVSHGPTDCGVHPSPGVYTRVSSYTAFINGNIHLRK